MENNQDQSSQDQVEGLSDLRLLLQSRGWALLNKHINNQITTRTDRIVLVPLERMDGVLEQEYQKGEIAALRMILALPGTLIEQAERLIKERDLEDESTDRSIDGRKPTGTP